MNKSIVWFKTDLRLHDNETLLHAIKHSDEIILVYCLDENHFKINEFGFKKTGNFRAKFLLESLIDLDENLKALGSELLILKGKPEQEILKVAKQYEVKNVFAKSELAFEEIKTQELVRQALLGINCKLETFETTTLFHPNDLPFAVKDIPDIFTNFRKRVEKESTIRSVNKVPEFIKSPKIEKSSFPTLNELGGEIVFTEKRAAIQFKGGETEACKRLQSYLFETKSILTYKQTRNELVGENYSSKFSAWLSLGCLSPRKIYNEIKKFETQFEANESTYWLVFELIWRDYFYFVMSRYGSKFFLLNGIKESNIHSSKHDPKYFEMWKNGETGNDFIDANMIELKLTGFMSNRGRQNVASFLCHNLKLDWRYGAAYFEEQLIDYDVCSNWGNWAYIAGVGNDPRENRVFNIEKQANDYDKNKAFRNLWLN